ncbi:hypothetical protein D9M72_589270 [compost metagenome]
MAHPPPQADKVQEVLGHVAALVHFTVRHGGQQHVLEGAHAVDQRAALVNVADQGPAAVGDFVVAHALQ